MKTDKYTQLGFVWGIIIILGVSLILIGLDRWLGIRF